MNIHSWVDPMFLGNQQLSFMLLVPIFSLTTPPHLKSVGLLLSLDWMVSQDARSQRGFFVCLFLIVEIEPTTSCKLSAI
jgi:hypothetical protein